MLKLSKTAFIFVALAASASAQDRSARNERDRLADDPTKMITKLGVRRTDDLSISGSVAFGPVSKHNALEAKTGR